MEKTDLKTGMKVRNKISGKVAEIRGDEIGKLLPSHEDYVIVRLRLGKAGKLHYPIWPVNNLEIIQPQGIVLEVRFWGYAKTKEGKPCNEWRVGRPDNKDCSSPSEARIKELGLSLLGTTETNENRFLGVRRWPSCLVLQILPKTDCNKIEALVAAINSETI